MERRAWMDKDRMKGEEESNFSEQTDYWISHQRCLSKGCSGNQVEG